MGIPTITLIGWHSLCWIVGSGLSIGSKFGSLGTRHDVFWWRHIPLCLFKCRNDQFVFIGTSSKRRTIRQGRKCRSNGGSSCLEFWIGPHAFFMGLFSSPFKTLYWYVGGKMTNSSAWLNIHHVCALYIHFFFIFLNFARPWSNGITRTVERRSWLRQYPCLFHANIIVAGCRSSGMFGCQGFSHAPDCNFVFDNCQRDWRLFARYLFSHGFTRCCDCDNLGTMGCHSSTAWPCTAAIVTKPLVAVVPEEKELITAIIVVVVVGWSRQWEILFIICSTGVVGKLAAFGFMFHSAAAVPGQPTPLASHQIILSLFFFVSPFMEVISQTARSFLPPYFAPVNDYIEWRKRKDSKYDAALDPTPKPWQSEAFSCATNLLIVWFPFCNYSSFDCFLVTRVFWKFFDPRFGCTTSRPTVGQIFMDGCLFDGTRCSLWRGLIGSAWIAIPGNHLPD